MTKHQLRQRFLAERNQLPPTEVTTKSQIISEAFFKNVVLNINCLHLFLPIVRKNEVNTWFIIEEIWKNYSHIQLVVPKSQRSTYQMESYFLEKNTKIVENEWSIPEPIEATPCPKDCIDMILIPLLCFDQRGFRVGYGKGFYDRFLSQCRLDIIKIGLAFFPPVDHIKDIDCYDMRMDYCVQENHFFCFKSGG